jgi:hypothetical protein
VDERDAIKNKLRWTKSPPGSHSAMADSATFDRTCDELVQCSSLDALAARGTIRILLKASGLEAKTVDPDEMTAVVTRTLEEALRARGVESPEAVCSQVLSMLRRLPRTESDESPEAIFARLGGES